MPKFVIVPKVDFFHGQALPANVTSAELSAGEFDSMEGATAVAESALKILPNQSRVVAQVVARVSAEVSVATSVEKASK